MMSPARRNLRRRPPAPDKDTTVSRSRIPLAVLATAALALAACGDAGSDETAPAETPVATFEDDPEAPASDEPTAPAEATGAAGGALPGCDPASLQTLSDGVLTMATSEPAFEPWMVDNDPTNGQGYESAVAYAVAGTLGYDDASVEWVRVPFEAAIAPGPKDFDVAINQFSITDERRQAVDFSSSYYDVRQAVVTVEGSVAAETSQLDQMGELLFGAQVGTTSLDILVETVGPTLQPAVLNTN